MNRSIQIDPEERGSAVIAHLSGFAGYLIPLGGVIVPIIIMLVKKESPIVSSIAKQALYLNITAFICAIITFIMAITILLIPFAWLLGSVMGVAAVALPIIGAMKASEGYYFKYPIVGQYPR